MSPRRNEWRARLSWTGKGEAEQVKSIPIDKKPREGREVVITLGQRDNPDIALPDLEPGDLLEVGVDLEVTTDLTPKQAEQNARDGGKPAGQPYDYAPAIVAELHLVPDRKRAKEKPLPIGKAERMKLDHHRHHGLLVFSRTLEIPTEGLPWSGPSRVNLSLSANHKEAEEGQIVIIGQNEFNGSIKGDMGGVWAARTRPGRPNYGRSRTTRKIRTRGLDVQSSEWQVISSLKLENLKENEQLLVRGELTADPRDVGAVTRLKTRVFLADSPDQREPDGKSHAATVGSSSGQITKANGSNCLPKDGETVFRKSGVIRIVADSERPLHVNWTGQVGLPVDKTKTVSLKISAAELEIVRFKPERLG